MEQRYRELRLLAAVKKVLLQAPNMLQGLESRSGRSV